MLDIFEAGPVVRCALNDVRAIRESQRAVVEQIVQGPMPPAADASIYLISNCRDSFRAAHGPLLIDANNRPSLPAEIARALDVGVGDPVRYVLLKPAPKAQRYHDANVSFD
jgi:arginine/ornithine N-succinyltransferase beta subunit